MTTPNIPSIPTSVDPRVRQALESLRFYFRSIDLQGGAVTVDQITTGQVSIPSDSVQSSTKTIYFKPEGLIAVPAIGAVMLRWNSNLIGGIGYTDVLRAAVDDLTLAQSVAQVNGFSYTDYPTTDPEGQTFYYWIRFVGTDGIPGPANAVAGTPGVVSSDPAYIVDLLLGDEILLQVGDKIIINSVIIGDAAIGSAQIKQAAINDAHIDVLNADKIKTGTLEGITVKTTDPVTGRYSLLEGGDLSFYKGGVQTKYLKEIHAGSANSNTPVTIALDRAPQVQVSIRDLRAYDVAYANQNQRWVCRLLNDLVQDNGNGTYTFTPVCQLTLDAGAATEQLSYTYNSSTNTYTSGTKTTPTNTTKISIVGNVNSTRGTGASNTYYRRRAEVRLYRRVSPSGTWAYSSVTVDHGADFNADNFSIASPTLSSNTYDYYIQVIYSDTGATFTTGATEYDYDTDTVSNTGSGTLASAEITSVTFSASNSASGLLQLPAYTVPSGWAIDKVDYTAEYAYFLQVQVNSGGTQATASVTGIGGVSHELDQYFSGSKSAGNISTYQNKAWSSTSYTRDMTYSTNVYANNSAYAKGEIRYRNGEAVITIKKAKTNSTTPSNQAFVDSASFTLSQAQIIDGTGVVNWIAIA